MQKCQYTILIYRPVFSRAVPFWRFYSVCGLICACFAYLKHTSITKMAVLTRKTVWLSRNWSKRLLFSLAMLFAILLSYTASDDRVAARRLPENNSCSWPLSLLPVVKGVDPVSSVTTSTVPGPRPL